MESEKIPPIQKRTFTFLAIMAIITLAIWLVGLHVNVYRYKLLGAFFEMIWLPNIILTVAVPLGAGYTWMRENFNFRSRFLFLGLVYCLILLAIIYI